MFKVKVFGIGLVEEVSSLSEAVTLVKDSIDTHPEVLTGHRDIAEVFDPATDIVVAAVYRYGSEFVFARDSMDEKYGEEIEAIGYDVLSDSEALKTFAVWK